MMTNEIHKIVNEIDVLIRRNLWRDFRVVSYDGKKLIIGGSSDLIYFHEFEIIFCDVFFASCFFQEWTSDTKSPVFMIANDADANRINKEFEIEAGNMLFIFKAEYHKNDVIIAANSVSYNTDTVLYYYREDLNPGVRLANFVVKPD